jgi:hypothetical protein
MTDTEKISGLKNAIKALEDIGDKVAAEQTLLDRYGQIEQAERLHVEWLGLMDAIGAIKSTIHRLEGETDGRDSWVHEASVVSENREGKEYAIHTHAVTGELVCSCPDFEFRKSKNGQPCKHILKLRELAERAPSAATITEVPF